MALLSLYSTGTQKALGQPQWLTTKPKFRLYKCHQSPEKSSWTIRKLQWWVLLSPMVLASYTTLLLLSSSDVPRPADHEVHHQIQLPDMSIPPPSVLPDSATPSARLRGWILHLHSNILGVSLRNQSFPHVIICQMHGRSVSSSTTQPTASTSRLSRGHSRSWCHSGESSLCGSLVCLGSSLRSTEKR